MAAWAIGFVAIVALFGAGHAGHAGHGTALLWSRPSAMAAGDRSLIVGYDRGLELWQWHIGAVPVLVGHRPGPAVTTMWAGDSTVIWCEADSTLFLARIQGDAIDVRWQMSLPGPGLDATSSGSWLAVNVGGDSVLIVPVTGPGAGANWWHSGRSAGLAAVALRDSTLAVGGGEHVDLIRVRHAAAVTLDSIALGSFVLDAVWAGDTLAMAVGFSGVKLITTANDRFDGPPSSHSTGDAFTVIAATDRTWAAFDIFGAVEVFARGTSLTPAANRGTGTWI